MRRLAAIWCLLCGALAAGPPPPPKASTPTPPTPPPTPSPYAAICDTVISQCEFYVPGRGVDPRQCTCGQCYDTYMLSSDRSACEKVMCEGIDKCVAHLQVDDVCTCEECEEGYDVSKDGTACEVDDGGSSSGSGGGSMSGSGSGETRDVPLLPFIVVVVVLLVVCVVYVYWKSRQGGNDDEHGGEEGHPDEGHPDRYAPFDDNNTSFAPGGHELNGTFAPHSGSDADMKELEVSTGHAGYSDPPSPHLAQQQHHRHSHAPSDSGLPPGGFVANTPMGPMYVVPTPRAGDGQPQHTQPLAAPYSPHAMPHGGHSPASPMPGSPHTAGGPGEFPHTRRGSSVSQLPRTRLGTSGGLVENVSMSSPAASPHGGARPMHSPTGPGVAAPAPALPQQPSIRPPAGSGRRRAPRNRGAL